MGLFSELLALREQIYSLENKAAKLDILGEEIFQNVNILPKAQNNTLLLSNRTRALERKNRFEEERHVPLGGTNSWMMH